MTKQIVTFMQKTARKHKGAFQTANIHWMSIKFKKNGSLTNYDNFQRRTFARSMF